MTVVSMLGFWLAATPARADLIDLGNGMIYDSVQDLTWLQDPMYARTSGFDGDGRMTYDEAVGWADGLEYGGFSDWRLPQLYSGGWWAQSDSEISRLLHQVGWRWEYLDPFSPFQDYVSGSAGPFVNFPQSTFWLGENVWWSFVCSTDGADAETSRAWAVREGGAPQARVPEPSSLLLLGLGGLLQLGRWRRSRRRQR
jgi:hypothetical protein